MLADHKRFQRALALLSWVCLLPWMVGCCCPGKGFILHGDWSLELNRVNHIVGHQVEYEAGCGDSCAADSGEGGCWNGADDYGPSEAYHHPQFHPVPTQPVYGPTPARRPTEAMEHEPIPVPEAQSMDSPQADRRYRAPAGRAASTPGARSRTMGRPASYSPSNSRGPGPRVARAMPPSVPRRRPAPGRRLAFFNSAPEAPGAPSDDELLSAGDDGWHSAASGSPMPR